MYIEAPDAGDPGVRRFLEANTDKDGRRMNLLSAWAWRPEVFEGFVALRNLLTGQSGLSAREQALIVCATAAALGDSYCALAWGRKLGDAAGPGVAASVLASRTDAGLDAREAALQAWAGKVVHGPNQTCAADVQLLRDAGFGEREIFEATAFIAFRLAFSTVNDALGLQPDAYLAAALPEAVRAAVDYGRPVA